MSAETTACDRKMKKLFHDLCNNIIGMDNRRPEVSISAHRQGMT